ncbi:MAG: flagellar hook-associated protein 3, partial [Burkholderiaceae bacterium]
MVDRISTANAYDGAINNLLSRQDILADTQEQMTSGKRVVKASDDPTAAARGERARAGAAPPTAGNKTGVPPTQPNTETRDAPRGAGGKL